MSIGRLPTELVIEIVASYLPLVLNLHDYLALRVLDRQFNHIILHALFELGVCEDFVTAGWPKLWWNHNFIFRYWRTALRRFKRNEDANVTDRSQPDASNEGGEDNHDRDQSHEILVKRALVSAISRIVARLERNKQSISVPTLSPLVQSLETLTAFDKCIYILCLTTIQLHGKQLAGDALTNNIEHSYFASDLGRDAYYVPNHDALAWELYAAVYLDDVEAVKEIIDSIKLHPTPRRVWRYRLSQDYNDFVVPTVWTTSPVRYPNATVIEQQWVKSASSALIIAGSMGHTDIIDYIMGIEPYLSRNGPRTQLWSTSLRSAMGQAVVHEQRKAFDVFLKHKWPLLTSTGFPRMNYWNGLRIAIETVQDRLDGNSVLERMLDMSHDWKCLTMVNQMLQAAASRNNLQLAKVIIDRLANQPPTFLTYSSVSTSAPVLPGKQRNHALGTAAWLGHVELVRLLLGTGHGMSYTDLEARTCAFHALICHLQPKEVTNNHLTILDELLRHTHGVELERAFVKAAHKHEVEFVSTIAQNIDLQKPSSLEWWGRCKVTFNDSAQPKLVGPTQGELMLAAALRRLAFKNARILISKYQVSLHHFFVIESASCDQFIMQDVADLKDCMATSNMSMKVDEIESLTYFEFRPMAQPDAQDFKYRIIRNPHCSK